MYTTAGRSSMSRRYRSCVSRSSDSMRFRSPISSDIISFASSSSEVRCEHAELQVVVRLTEPLLQVLLRRDVEHDALPRRGVARLVADQPRLVPYPHDPAVARDQSVLLDPRFARLVVQVMGRELDLAIVGMQQLGPDVRLVQPLLSRVAEQGLHLRADEQRAPLVVRVHLVDDGGNLLDEHAVASLRGAEAVLGALAVGQVLDQPLPVHGGAVAVADQDRGFADEHASGRRDGTGGNRRRTSRCAEPPRPTRRRRDPGRRDG